MNINFDTSYLSKEEATGLAALIAAINGTLPTMAEIRSERNKPYDAVGYATTALSPVDAKSAVFASSHGPSGEPEVVPVSDEKVAEIKDTEPAKRTRKKKDDAPATQQSISTGEERVGPEDDAATGEAEVEQDKADEKAEAEASRPADKAYTVDDVKNAFGLYIQKFGMDAVKEDGVNILADALANETLPAGENFWKASIIPEARYADVIKAFETAASADQRYKRKGA